MMNWLSKRSKFVALSIAILCAVSVSGRLHEETIAPFFTFSRAFEQAPALGITLLSDNEDEGYLVDGETEQMTFSYAFMPASGGDPEQFSMSFSCDSPDVFTDDSCSINNEATDIVGSGATAYNTTVSCVFDRFPGTTTCLLSAVQNEVPIARMDLSEQHAVARQSASYDSVAVTVRVYGVVFYLLEEESTLSTATIVSGGVNSYEIRKYDRVAQGVREVRVFSILPGDDSTPNSSTMEYLSAANVSTTVSNKLVLYEPSTCNIADASVEDGEVVLLDGDRCGVGVAQNDGDGTSLLGVQIRPYKSGNFTLRMNWESIGTSSLDYEQSVTISVIEEAPPVILSVRKEDTYRSLPCDAEFLILTAVNVLYASSKTIVVQNSDGSTSQWAEATEEFSYDAESDTSTVTFQSAGGLGQNATFQLNVEIENEQQTAVVLDPSVPLTLTFTSPPVLSEMSPAVASVSGGEMIELSGSFDELEEEGRIYFDGYSLPSSSVVAISSSAISFIAPPLSSLGKPFKYEVSVGSCAERSSSLTLTYLVEPIVEIIAANSSTDESGAYLVSSSGGAAFLAQVSGNNDGVEYEWRLFSEDGVQIPLNELVTDTAVLTVTYTLVSTGRTFELLCKVTNSLGLSDTKEVTLAVAEALDYLTVQVYDVANLSRAVEVVTLIQASVQYVSAAGEVQALAAFDMNLKWTFGDREFVAADDLPNSLVTGPTQYGLEFNIARRDLSVGKTKLTLEASLADKPEIKGSYVANIIVTASQLSPQINGDLNGTLVLPNEDLRLSAANSSDPDVLEGEGDPTDGLEYSWFSCKKSLSVTFSLGVDDCASVFPADVTTQDILVRKADLSAARMDTSDDPDPTYISFGLRIRKDNRAATTYLFFELRSLEKAERIPTLSAVQIVDTKGLPLTEFSTLSDIIIQPESEQADVVWQYDMSSQAQRYLFATTGVFKGGFAFETRRGVLGRKALGFNAKSLKPSTEYKISVTASAPDTSLESSYEVSFRTLDLPSLKCVAPMISSGIVSETRFVISGQLSFETLGIEYCFYLRKSAVARYSVGKGCSTVPFAEFSFPQAGTFAIECVAKTVGGAVVDNVTLSTSLIISTPLPNPTSSEVEVYGARLDNLNNEADRCESLKDHSCITNLLAGVASATSEVSLIFSGDSSEAAQSLLDRYRSYVVRLSNISDNLAKRIVYRPNQVTESIDLAFSMSQVPPEFVNDDDTLFGYMRPAEEAANSTSSGSSQAIIDNEIVDKAAGLANLTIAKAYGIAQSGSSRRRLLQDAEVVRSSLAVAMQASGAIIARLRSQQETCGYSGTDSTAFPTYLGGDGEAIAFEGTDVSPLDVNVKVSCTQSQISTGLQGSQVRLDICPDALSATELRRTVVSVVEIPEIALVAAGFLTSVDSYVNQLADVELTGALPPDCYQVVMKRKADSLAISPYDRLVGGVLRSIPSRSASCTAESCYVFNITTSSASSVTFSDDFIVVQVSEPGLYIAGNYTGKALQPTRSETLSGKWTGVGAQTISAIGILLVFVAAVVITLVLAATRRGVASAPDGPGEMFGGQGLGWEFVERDRFGREPNKDAGGGANDSMARLIPEGARPPVVGGTAKGTET